MRSVGAFEAKTHLSRLLDDVSRGETIAITKHGRPVALLVPPRGPRADVGDVLDGWRAYRRAHNITLGGGSLRDLIEDGRRL